MVRKAASAHPLGIKMTLSHPLNLLTAITESPTLTTALLNLKLSFKCRQARSRQREIIDSNHKLKPRNKTSGLKIKDQTMMMAIFMKRRNLGL